MPRGSKDAYTDKQKRQAEHIEESYKQRGVSNDTAEARAWATVNKESGGGNKSGSGRKSAAKATSPATARKGVAKKSSPSTGRNSAAKRTSAGRKRSTS